MDAGRRHPDRAAIQACDSRPLPLASAGGGSGGSLGAGGRSSPVARVRSAARRERRVDRGWRRKSRRRGSGRCGACGSHARNHPGVPPPSQMQFDPGTPFGITLSRDGLWCTPRGRSISDASSPKYTIIVEAGSQPRNHHRSDGHLWLGQAAQVAAHRRQHHDAGGARQLGLGRQHVSLELALKRGDNPTESNGSSSRASAQRGPMASYRRSRRKSGGRVPMLGKAGRAAARHIAVHDVAPRWRRQHLVTAKQIDGQQAEVVARIARSSRPPGCC